MTENEQGSSSSSEASSDIGGKGVPAIEEPQLEHPAPPQIGGRSPPNREPIERSREQPVLDQPEPPTLPSPGRNESENESDVRPMSGARVGPAPTRPAKEEDDTVTDRKGRSPNPPAMPAP